jgi:hypothetical protein
MEKLKHLVTQKTIVTSKFFRVRRDWYAGDLTSDAAILRDIAAADVTEAQIAADRAQYSADWTNGLQTKAHHTMM